MADFGASAAGFDSPRYCFVFLYSSTVVGRPLTTGAGAGGVGGVNWHCLVLVFSYSVRPSGSCVVVHHWDWEDGGVAPGAANRTQFPPLGGGTPPLSTQRVIIIIATEAVAQFTIGDPVQNAVDILPLTSNAILIRLPVGVTF